MILSKEHPSKVKAKQMQDSTLTSDSSTELSGVVCKEEGGT